MPCSKTSSTPNKFVFGVTAIGALILFVCLIFFFASTVYNICSLMSRWDAGNERAILNSDCQVVLENKPEYENDVIDRCTKVIAEKEANDKAFIDWIRHQRTEFIRNH